MIYAPGTYGGVCGGDAYKTHSALVVLQNAAFGLFEAFNSALSSIARTEYKDAPPVKIAVADLGLSNAVLLARMDTGDVQFSPEFLRAGKGIEIIFHEPVLKANEIFHLRSVSDLAAFKVGAA